MFVQRLNGRGHLSLSGFTVNLAHDPPQSVFDGVRPPSGRLAQIAERGKLNAVFFADSSSEGNVSDGSPWYLELLTAIASLSRATEKIGFISTVPSTFYTPFHAARLVASLDISPTSVLAGTWSPRCSMWKRATMVTKPYLTTLSVIAAPGRAVETRETAPRFIGGHRFPRLAFAALQGRSRCATGRWRQTGRCSICWPDIL